QRNMEEQINGDGASQDFGKITGSNGQFAQEPVGPAAPFRIIVTAGLGQVFAGYYSEASRHDLQENGHKAGNGNHPQQAVFELRSGGEVGAPVAGVHVANAYEERGANVRAPLLPESRLGGWDGNR